MLQSTISGSITRPGLTGVVRRRWETVPMRLYRDRAVVLRQHKLGEADRIVTLLTRDHGLVRAVAKGVRRTRSKFGARLEPFAHIDVQLHPGRNLDIVTQVVSLDAFTTDIVAGVMQRLDDRDVSVLELDVLADQRDANAVLGRLDPLDDARPGF